MRNRFAVSIALVAGAGITAPFVAADETPRTEQVTLGDPGLTSGIPGSGPLATPEIRKWLDDPRNHAALEPVLPLGLDAGQAGVKGLAENPMTRAKIELGRQLYFDPRLSADGKVSCATCHEPTAGWTAHTKTGEGIRGQKGARNSPVSFNRIVSDAQFWDGRAKSLEEQAVGPIQNPIEMGNTHAACVKTLAGVEGYRLQFERIFGGVTIDAVGKAIATFERAVVTGPAPFDYYERWARYKDVTDDEMKEDAVLAAKTKEARGTYAAHKMSDAAVRGRGLFFGKANCTACHVGANLTDESFRNLGVGMASATPDLGRFDVTKDDKDKGRFKTPTCRNVAETSPYMHDGSVGTLEEVVAVYNRGGFANPGLDEKVRRLDLSDGEATDLVEFLKALTGAFPPVETGRLPK